MTCYANMDQYRRDWVTYAIYFNPKDFPGQYVVRAFLTTEGPDPIPFVKPAYVGDSLEDARAVIPQGRVHFPRFPQDPPSVVEVWL